MERSVPSAPGYAVTDDGRVISYKSRLLDVDRFEMKQCLDKYGYPFVGLRVDGQRRKFSVHRLVAEAFLGPRPSPYHQVRHLDGVRTNNNASNLCWGTHAENMADRAQHGNQSNGQEHSEAMKSSAVWQAYWTYVRSPSATAKIPPEDYRVICQRIAQGETQRSIAEGYEVDAASISFFLKREMLRACGTQDALVATLKNVAQLSTDRLARQMARDTLKDIGEDTP